MRRRKSEGRSQQSRPSRCSEPKRPVVIISKCLLGERCRYDGRVISVPALRRLSRMLELVPVCPETGIGLPVPRDPIRLVKAARGISLVQTRTGKDLTGRMRSYCRRFLAALRPDGFILKARSPSCAVLDAKVYDAQGRETGATAAGLFAASALARYPGVVVVDETALAGRGALDRLMAGICH